jgi:hypothetical protein
MATSLHIVIAEFDLVDHHERQVESSERRREEPPPAVSGQRHARPRPNGKPAVRRRGPRFS